MKGAINAALFLKQFISGTALMHLDIAGPAYNEKGNALREPGSTGFGLRLMLDIALNWELIWAGEPEKIEKPGSPAPRANNL